MATGRRCMPCPSDEGSPIYTALLSAINSAVVSVHITNAYFVPNPEFLDALKAAAGRGVDVKLINDFSRQMRAAFTRDLAESEEILLEQWEQRPLNVRLLEMAARVWEYWR